MWQNDVYMTQWKEVTLSMYDVLSEKQGSYCFLFCTYVHIEQSDSNYRGSN